MPPKEPKDMTVMTLKQIIFSGVAVAIFMGGPCVALAGMVYDANLKAVHTKIETVEIRSNAERLRMIEATQKNTDRIEAHAASIVVIDKRGERNDMEHEFIKAKLDEIIIRVERRNN